MLLASDKGTKNSQIWTTDMEVHGLTSYEIACSSELLPRKPLRRRDLKLLYHRKSHLLLLRRRAILTFKLRHRPRISTSVASYWHPGLSLPFSCAAAEVLPVARGARTVFKSRLLSTAKFAAQRRNTLLSV